MKGLNGWTWLLKRVESQGKNEYLAELGILKDYIVIERYRYNRH